MGTKMIAGLGRVAGQISLWRELRRSRAALAQLTPRDLADIGLAPGAAAFEAAKCFWQR